MISVLRSAAPAPDAPVGMVPPSADYYNVSEAAQVLGVSRMTISRWIRPLGCPPRGSDTGGPHPP